MTADRKLEASREGSILKNKYFTKMCSGSEAGSYLRLIDFCITQLCDRNVHWFRSGLMFKVHRL